MKVAHVTTVHQWNDGRIFERQARSLRDAGHDVVVIAPGSDREVDGIDVIGLGESRRRADRMLRLVGNAARAVRREQPDVVVIHDPELLRWLFVESFRRERARLVYDAHEDYSAQLRDKEWLPGLLRRPLAFVLGALERAVARRADHVFTATPAIARRFDSMRTTVVLNRPQVSGLPDVPEPAADLDADRRSSDDGSGPARLVYVGDLRAVRGARSLVDAMRFFDDDEVELRIVGRVTPPELLDELQQSPGWSKCDLLGWRDHEEVFAQLLEADVALLPFLPAENHRESQPNKLFEYLVVGLPVVMSDFPTWRSIAAEVGAHVEAFHPGDGASLAAAVRRVLESPPPTTRAERAASARRDLSWEALESEYLQRFRSLTESG